jgi:hypothetical protein
MPHLTVNQIRRLLEELEYETMFNDNATIRLQKRMGGGYSDNAETAAIQGKLSVMLEVAAGMEARGL